MDKNFKFLVEKEYRTIQHNICVALENEDGEGKFIEDAWERPGGGGGFSRVLTNGKVIEKGGVNFSAVHGPLPDAVAKEFKVEQGTEFFATGVSIVIHPKNPMVPIIHMNIRYFELANGICWFGGGIDLTPHYVVPEQATFFHEQLKEVCDQFNPEYYAKYKTWADDYFFNPHRNETRGIGGIFYDHLKPKTEEERKHFFDLTVATGNKFAPTYTRFMRINKEKPFTEEHKAWQYLRRGRYVEFNLVYDRGTKFGLQTNGRTESILMSLPPMAGWEYSHTPKENSPEGNTLKHLKKNIDWINYGS
ncbi:MAG: oxygen-dependent coproporphyrinogen oxidase [Luteibaculaceae bacterium]